MRKRTPSSHKIPQNSPPPLSHCSIIGDSADIGGACDVAFHKRMSGPSPARDIAGYCSTHDELLREEVSKGGTLGESGKERKGERKEGREGETDRLNSSLLLESSEIGDAESENLAQTIS